MDVYISEEQQLQKIKEWWKKYGTLLLTGILVVLILSFGWRFWRHYKTQRADQASIIYEQMVAATMMKKTDDFTLYANHLINDYSATPYAGLASLLLAKAAIEANNLKAAEQHLQWVVSNADSKSLQQVARIRAARILLAEKQPEQALQMLNKIDDNTFDQLTFETKGDILLSMGKKPEALNAYQSALKTSKQDATKLNLLQMKINNLK